VTDGISVIQSVILPAEMNAATVRLRHVASWQLREEDTSSGKLLQGDFGVSEHQRAAQSDCRAGCDTMQLSIALQMVLMLENVEYRLK
jgi:hypothetical protein